MSRATNFNQSVAVVISTYNRPKALHLLLFALSTQTRMPNEIFIADDGSDERTEKVIKNWIEKGLPITHCWHDDRGYRKTIVMNQALSKVKSTYVIFLDGDCVPRDSFVADHLQLSEPGYILAGGRVLATKAFTETLESAGALPPISDFIYWIRQRMSGNVNRLLPFFRLPDGDWRKTKPRKWQLVRGCNFSLDMSSVRKVDGFEESLHGWGPDDSDIAVRLINMGMRVKTARFAAQVLHLWHKEEDRGNLTKNREYLQDAINSGRIRAVIGLSAHHS